MSITFRTSNHTCDCSRRWLRECEVVGHDMSLWPEPYSCDICINLEMNLANENAFDLLNWLDLECVPYGEAPAKEVAAKCRRRGWDEKRNHDDGVPATETQEPGCAKVIYCGRAPNYLRNKTEQLLKIAEAAGEGMIVWD